MKIISILALLVVFCSASLAQSRSVYVGYEYRGVNPGKTLPNGVKHLGGSLLSDVDASPMYGVSQVQKSETKMLWLEVSTDEDATGIKAWKVLDVLTFSTLARTRYVFFEGDPAIGCSRRGKRLENLVGEGRIMRAQNRFVPSNLWIANLKKKRFEKISLTDVSCEYSEP